jgi:hypothetical protein
MMDDGHRQARQGGSHAIPSRAMRRGRGTCTPHHAEHMLDRPIDAGPRRAPAGRTREAGNVARVPSPPAPVQI